MKPLPNLICPICGGPNECAPAKAGSFDVPCWCRDAKIDSSVIERVPKEFLNKACVCPRCAAGLNATPSSQD